jgi:hypothetical protein
VNHLSGRLVRGTEIVSDIYEVDESGWREMRTDDLWRGPKGMDAAAIENAADILERELRALIAIVPSFCTTRFRGCVSTQERKLRSRRLRARDKRLGTDS